MPDLQERLFSSDRILSRYALPAGIGHATSCGSGTNVCMITRNMPFRTGLFTKHFDGEYRHRSRTHGL
jgi:hypothetical protein